MLVVLFLCGCAIKLNGPSIEITEMPPADKGRVTGAQSNQVVVLYARSGAWYVQPYADQQFTPRYSSSATTSPHR